ncbi:hypothetical protein FEV53_18345 [Palleronia caenipelagi]|uniref:Uncharacterized protein n=2 Tax=Palleronia caenipelagi TaxID=2489174 RepID=A0A547PKY3_9RHOB|nr:hypothetical protein FEV53_18345 [Palleronia caenipelagi]
MRLGGDGLPKPFVMLADVDGPDLIAGLRIFGFAIDWMPAADHAFVDALRHRLPWKRLVVQSRHLVDRI